MKRLKILITFQYLHRDSPIFFMILSSKIKNLLFLEFIYCVEKDQKCWTSSEKCVKFDNESFKEFVMGAKWYDNCLPWNSRTNECSRVKERSVDDRPHRIIKLHIFMRV